MGRDGEGDQAKRLLIKQLLTQCNMGMYPKEILLP